MSSHANLGELPTDGLPNGGFIRQKELLKVVPFSHATLWRKVSNGSFPRPFHLSEKVTAWNVAEIRSWLKTLSPAGAA